MQLFIWHVNKHIFVWLNKCICFSISGFALIMHLHVLDRARHNTTSNSKLLSDMFLITERERLEYFFNNKFLKLCNFICSLQWYNFYYLACIQFMHARKKITIICINLYGRVWNRVTPLDQYDRIFCIISNWIYNNQQR